MASPHRAFAAAAWILAAGAAWAQDAKTDPSPQAVQALLTRLAAIDISDAAFRKLDTDHDGRISALEANANPKVAARFLDADKNHDGYLSLEEFKSLGNAGPADSATSPPPGNAHSDPAPSR
jgi:hypothetical protein